eukprot:gb/GEZN01003876.1/.p1 GENE.gb/GEZN01003876.1/~~gb/GEZN01003876.1/.p1  ORF type:complete len:466 (+),score=88.26 gb/GEZN01003876.1/:52-1449(+)
MAEEQEKLPEIDEHLVGATPATEQMHSIWGKRRLLPRLPWLPALSDKKESPLIAKRATLKKVPVGKMRDSSVPNLSLAAMNVESKDSEEAYRASVLECNIESWITKLGPHTFPTELLPISKEDGQLFMDSYQAFETYHKKCQMLGVAANNFNPPPRLAKKAMVLMGKLQATIEKVQEGDATRPVFVKASSRSPKDAPAGLAKLEEQYVSLLKHGSKSQQTEENFKIRCILTAGHELMKIKSAQDAVALFLRSERICQDMNLAMSHSKGEWHENWVVRKWFDVDVGMEFRGFVHKGTLTAISQYNHLCYFPYVHKQEKEISALLVNFFEKEIQPRLKTIPSYVVDFALVSTSLTPSFADSAASDAKQEVPPSLAINALKPLVIELNPFLETTDGCLFSWQKERSILEQGPFTFRIQSKAQKGAKAMISHDWRRLLELNPDIPRVTISLSEAQELDDIGEEEDDVAE